jgi:hypothetical protein
MNKNSNYKAKEHFRKNQGIFKLGFYFLTVTIAIIMILQPALAVADQWTTITPGGTAGKIFNTIASADTYVFLGTDHGIYRSTDRGANWTPFNTGLTSQNITSIVIGSVYNGGAFVADGDTPVFAATTNGIFRATLGGSSWTSVNAGMADVNVSDVEIDQYNAIAAATTTGIYAGTIGTSSYGIYRSDNSADTWTLKNDGMLNLKIQKLTSGTDLGANHYIFALTATHKIYAANPYSSTGSDENWNEVYDAGSTTTKDVVISPTMGTIAYLATENGILRGGDPGDLTAWTLINNGLTNTDINTIAHDFSNPGYSYVGSNGGGVFKTIDDGANWSGIGLNSQNIKSVATDPTDPLYIYAITGSDVFRMQLSTADAMPGSVDLIAPGQITDLTFNSVSTSTLTLNWSAPGDDNNSGTAASYDIRYSTSTLSESNFATATPASGMPTPSLAGTVEGLNMSSLEASTTYYFAIKASDEAFNTSTISTLGSVTTDPLDITGPVISGISAHNISGDRATISWTTNEGATSQVQYGLTSSYGSTTTLDASYVSAHSVLITGLSSSTVYHFRIHTRDSSNNLTTSVDDTFTTSSTPDNTEPSSPGNLSGSSITTNSITVNWSASSDNIAVIGYNIYRNNEFIASTTALNFTDLGLNLGTSYVYTITAYDAASNESPRTNNITLTTTSGSVIIIPPSSGGGGGGGGAMTPADTTAPAMPASLVISYLSTGLQLTWKNPADADFAGVIVVRKEGGFPTSRTDGLKLYQGKTEFYADSAVDSAKKYYYGIWSYDASGNYSSMASIASTSGKIQTGQNDVKNNTADPGANKNPSDTSADSQTIQVTSLGNVPGSVVEQVSTKEASALFSGAVYAPLDEIEKILYLDLIKLKVKKAISGQGKFSMANFIKYGTPTTKKLGSGERAGVTKSYYNAFKKLPDSVAEWKDIIKIANGRYPSERSKDAEDFARTSFKKVYKRLPDIKNPKDSNALMVMAYGLRPAIRNMNSERAAMKIFKAIYKKGAASPQEWDIVRTIAYSGTRR